MWVYWVFLMLVCISLLVFYLCDYDRSTPCKYFNFALENKLFGKFMERHYFAYVMFAFWGTALPSIGIVVSLVSLIKLIP